MLCINSNVTFKSLHVHGFNKLSWLIISLYLI
jgi:hypothetical protein